MLGAETPVHCGAGTYCCGNYVLENYLRVVDFGLRRRVLACVLVSLLYHRPLSHRLGSPLQGGFFITLAFALVV